MNVNSKHSSISKWPLAAAMLAIPMMAVAQTEVTDTVPVATYDLDDFQVVATKALIQSDGAKLTYNIDEDPSSKGLTVSDALRKVPMVSVDGEGNIRINGDSNFKIYVNGKEDSSLTSNYKDLFKSMPAETIVKVEVITEPGAKYDAEGTGGILNLITIRKNATDGYSGSLNLGLGLRQAYLSGNARMRKGRFALNADITYANNGLKKQENFGNIETENFVSPLFCRQLDENHQRIGYDVVQGSLGMSFDLSDRDLLTASASVNAMNADILNGSTMASTIWDNSGNVVSRSARRFGGNLKQNSLFADASWQHNFNEAGNNMVLSYRYSHGLTELYAHLTRAQQEGIETVAGYQLIDQHQNTNEHTVQLDWTNPLADGRHTLEAGAKAVWRDNPADSYTLLGPDQASATEGDSRTDMKQFQDVYAAYIGYKGSFGKLAASAGVRYEHTRMGIDFLTGGYKDFSNRLNDVVPNAALTYMFGPASNLRLAYQMRISRPGISQVNPYVFSYLPGQVQTGNPDLKSARSNKISLTYSSFGRTFGGNIGVEYSAVGNAIQAYAYTLDNTIYQTYANIGHDRQASLRGMLSWTVIPQMQLMVNANLSHVWMETTSPDYSNRGWSLNYGGSWNYTLPCRIRLSAYGGQQTRRHELQGYSNGWFYYGLGLNRDFLRNDALSLGISASEFFTPNPVFTSLVGTDQMRVKSAYKNKRASLNISIGWNFGNLKQGVRKTNQQILNDDVDNTSKSGLM